MSSNSICNHTRDIINYCMTTDSIGLHSVLLPFLIIELFVIININFIIIIDLYQLILTMLTEVAAGYWLALIFQASHVVSEVGWMNQY